MHVVKFFVAVAYAGGRGLRDVNPRMTPESVATVDRGLTAKREYHVVPNTNHFAFVTPGPPTLPEPKPEGCTDPPGFDRAAFHKEFNVALLAFFRANLDG